MGHLLSCRECLVAGEVQDMGHLLSCRDCPQKCTLEDLWLANKNGFDVAQYWAKNL
jgi:hypothetical protein